MITYIKKVQYYKLCIKNKKFSKRNYNNNN